MIKAKTNDYGGFTSDVPKTWGKTTTWSAYPQVDKTYGESTVREQRWLRDGYSQNRVKSKLGVYPWRDNSYYQRLIISYEYDPAKMWYVKPYGSGTQTDTYQGYYSIEVAHVTFLWTYPMGSGGNPKTLVSEKARARTECLLKLNEGKVNIGQALAESVQTYDMLAKSAKDLFRALLEARKRNWGYFRRYKQGSLGIANGLLAFDYGWKPLMSDLKGLYDEFQDSTTRAPIVRAVREVKSQWSDSSTNSYWVDRRQQANVVNKCEIWAKLSSDFMAQAQAHGLLNPLALAWELVPYSFVVDWAFPIGNVLEAMSAKAGLDFVGGYESQRIEGGVTASRSLPAGYSGKAVSCEADYFSYRRDPLSGFPIPQVYAKSPFSTQHAADALALWRQLF